MEAVAVMNNPPTRPIAVSRIKALGVQISMDDFGISYSSFSYLRSLPINILMIDQSFVRDIIID
jgi:EAL domain-containing protein (putative c-di-GMP-specific phosphodiesterase class I)